MLIRPFQRTIVDVIPHDRGANIGAGQNDASKAQPISDRIPLINMIARNNILRPTQDSKMAELRSPVVPQLYIISVGIENNAFAVLRFFLILGRVKKTIVNQHALTACTNRGDRPMSRAGDITITQLKQPTRLRQHNGAGFSVALKFNVGKAHFIQQPKTTNIKQILKPRKCIFLGAFRRIKWL